MVRLVSMVCGGVALVLTSAGALAATPAPATPIGNPGEWVTTDDYPAPALREGRSGIVVFRLAVNNTGKVGGCEVVSGSGSADLDTATCALITQRAQFRPATDANGAPTSGTYFNRIRWTLPTPTPQQLPVLIRCGADADLQMICLT